MARIREDIVGVVSVAGLILSPGDEVPEGVIVGAHVLDPDSIETVSLDVTAPELRLAAANGVDETAGENVVGPELPATDEVDEDEVTDPELPAEEPKPKPVARPRASAKK